MKVYTVGLSGYGRRQPHDQSPGDACVEGRVFEKGRGGGVSSSVLACLHFISAAETAELPSGAQILE